MKLPGCMTALTYAAIAVLLVVSAPAGAQAMAGRDFSAERVHVAYYRTPPGRQDEWLALYKKYHKPIMDYQIRNGMTLSSKLYAPRFHDGEKAWDFVIVTVSPTEGRGPKPGMTRAELIRKLFPDVEDYVRGERQRWALTLACQEGELVEIDATRDPVSLYYPLDPPSQKK